MVPPGRARTSSVSNRSTATHQRFEVVVAVGPLAEDFEEQVEFGRGGDDDAVRPGGEGRVDREGVRVPGRVMVSVGGGSPEGSVPSVGATKPSRHFEPRRPGPRWERRVGGAN